MVCLLWYHMHRMITYPPLGKISLKLHITGSWMFMAWFYCAIVHVRFIWTKICIFSLLFLTRVQINTTLSEERYKLACFSTQSNFNITMDPKSLILLSDCPGWVSLVTSSHIISQFLFLFFSKRGWPEERILSFVYMNRVVFLWKLSFVWMNSIVFLWKLLIILT